MTRGAAAAAAATALQTGLESGTFPAARAAVSLQIAHCRLGAGFEGGQRRERPHQRPGYRPPAGRAAHPYGVGLSGWTNE